MRIEIPFPALFRAEEKPEAFRDLLYRCVEARGSLAVRLAADSAEITVSDEAVGQIDVFGRWRGPGLAGDPADEVGVKLLLPLVFRFCEIVLPHGQIYTTGRAYRSVADFFVRNLFFAIARNERVAFRAVPRGDVPAHAAAEFQRQYFYLIKGYFPEPVFHRNSVGDAMDLLAANLFLPVATFENPLLRHGGRALRQAVRAGEASELKAGLLDARAAMMAHFGT
ncbi:hypothetical protein [Aquabacter spiritensis]|uniref:Uncharacterized protein n=1 Tax=Aquabacter spiritensis TaxID=933073 RepID=A0A4R3LZ42_9HYPH|nr:hypothetical protein [Aquabacter spiritensis]TCT04007.1 hypothetical protein EDC64_108173 [Aquabacter spiritensis]